MSRAGHSPAVSRRDPAVRKVARAWRTLTGGRDHPGCRRTVLACSGGADSSGLAIALAAALGRQAEGLLVVGHIVHDLRPEAEALADRDAAAELARRLGLPFAEARINCRGQGNLEAAARRLRYEALAALANRHRCPFIATAHHSGDQLETLLMGVLRGAGPAGLAGVSARRGIGDGGVRIVRPCLGIPKEELTRLCRDFGWAWREDTTNQDLTRLRAALRHRVIPEIKHLRPGAERQATRAAHLLRDSAGLVEDVAREVRSRSLLEIGAERVRLARKVLAEQREVVVGAVLRRVAIELRGTRGQDQFGRAALEPVIGAIRDGRGEVRRFEWKALVIEVRGTEVELRRVP